MQPATSHSSKCVRFTESSEMSFKTRSHRNERRRSQCSLHTGLSRKTFTHHAHTTTYSMCEWWRNATFRRMFWSEHGTSSRIWQANMDLTNKIPLQNEHATFIDPISALPPLLMIVLTSTWVYLNRFNVLLLRLGCAERNVVLGELRRSNGA